MIDKFKEFLRNTPNSFFRNALEDYTFNVKIDYRGYYRTINELLKNEKPEDYVRAGFDWELHGCDYWCYVNKKWNEFLNKQNE